MASEIVPNLLPWNLIVSIKHPAKKNHKSLEGSYIRKSNEPKWTQLNGENFIWAEKEWISGKNFLRLSESNKWIIGSTSEKIFCSVDEVTVDGPDMNTKWKYHVNSTYQSFSGPRINVEPGK